MRFENEVERRLERLAHRTESGGLHDLLELARSGLRAENVGAVLGNRMRTAHGRRSSVVETADRSNVLLDAVASKGLDDHECAVLAHRARRIAHGIDRPTH